jgi:hypothetical protein
MCTYECRCRKKIYGHFVCVYIYILGRYARVAARAVGLRACVWYMYLHGLNVHQNVQ